MKQLFKIAINNGIFSFVPIAQWFLFGLVIDSRIINIFGITYPLQFIFLILSSIFVTGANINATKHNKNTDMNAGFYWLVLFGFLLFGTLILYTDTYLSFMNMGDVIYHDFTVYGIWHLYLGLIFSAIIGKLYFNKQENLASKFTIIFNALDLLITYVLLVIIPCQPIIIIRTLLFTNVLVLLYMLAKVPIHFAFKCNPISFIKNEAIDIITYTICFISYIFGLRVTFGYGSEYALAASFCTTISDIQWDMASAIGTVTKIRICDKTFDYKQQLKHAYILATILISSIMLFFFIGYPTYGVTLHIGLIIISIEVVAMLLDTNIKIKVYYLALHGHMMITAIKKIISSLFRLSISLFLMSPYCTSIGGVLQFIAINVFIYSDFKNTYDKPIK